MEKEKQPQVVVTQPTGCGTLLPQGTPQHRFLCSPLLPSLGTGHRNQNHPVPPGQPRLRAGKQRPTPFFHPRIPAKPAWKTPLSRLISPGEVVTKAAADLRCAELTAVCKPGQEDPATLHRPQGRENAENESGFSGFCREKTTPAGRAGNAF